MPNYMKGKRMEHITTLGERDAVEWLNTDQVADYLDVAKRTVEDWRLDGRGPHFCKAGRLVRYSRADVDAWLASTRAKSTSEQHAAA